MLCVVRGCLLDVCKDSVSVLVVYLDVCLLSMVLDDDIYVCVNNTGTLMCAFISSYVGNTVAHTLQENPGGWWWWAWWWWWW